VDPIRSVPALLLNKGSIGNDLQRHKSIGKFRDLFGRFDLPLKYLSMAMTNCRCGNVSSGSPEFKSSTTEAKTSRGTFSQFRNRFGFRSDAETRGNGFDRGLVRRLDRGLARRLDRGVMVIKILSSDDAWAYSERGRALVVFDLSSEREVEREVALGVFERGRALLVFTVFTTDRSYLTHIEAKDRDADDVGDDGFFFSNFSPHAFNPRLLRAGCSDFLARLSVSKRERRN